MIFFRVIYLFALLVLPEAIIAVQPGLPEFSPHQRQEAWDRAVSAGRETERRYEHRCRWPALNKVVDTGAYHFIGSLPQRYPTPFDDIIGRSNVFPVNVDHSRAASDLRSPQGMSAYHNLFDPGRGLIICHENDKRRDYHAPRLDLSDILFESYDRVAQHQATQPRHGPVTLHHVSRFFGAGSGRLQPPRFIVYASINTVGTKMVLEEAHVRRMLERRTWARREEVKAGVETFVHGQDAFHALLGTIEGISILLMLRDHCQWAQRRRVRSIRTTNIPHEHGEAGGSWYMLIELDA